MLIGTSLPSMKSVNLDFLLENAREMYMLLLGYKRTVSYWMPKLFTDYERYMSSCLYAFPVERELATAMSWGHEIKHAENSATNAPPRYAGVVFLCSATDRRRNRNKPHSATFPALLHSNTKGDCRYCT